MLIMPKTPLLRIFHSRRPLVLLNLMHSKVTDKTCEDKPKFHLSRVPQSGPSGMFSGLLNKIADTATAPPQAQTTQQTSRSGPNESASQQSSSQQGGGFFSGLFSTNQTPAQSQQGPPGSSQQQQGNRQPLQRQNPIPSHTPSTPEPSHGGLLSGLFNKLASVDTPGPSSTSVSGVQHNQQTSRPDASGQSQTYTQQPPPSNQSSGLLSGLLKMGSEAAAPKITFCRTADTSFLWKPDARSTTSRSDYVTRSNTTAKSVWWSVF